MKMKILGAVILGLSVLTLPLPTGAFFHQRKALVVPGALVGIVGSPVRSSDGQGIGTIKQLLVNPEDGELTYGVVARGAFSGLARNSSPFPGRTSRWGATWRTWSSPWSGRSCRKPRGSRKGRTSI